MGGDGDEVMSVDMGTSGEKEVSVAMEMTGGREGESCERGAVCRLGRVWL